MQIIIQNKLEGKSFLCLQVSKIDFDNNCKIFFLNLDYTKYNSIRDYLRIQHFETLKRKMMIEILKTQKVHQFKLNIYYFF
jgi:hypothetical protein